MATPETEETLLMIALHGTAHHVETVARYFRQAREAAELSREAQQQAARTLHYGFDQDGSLVLKARLPALAGALVIKALEAAVEVVPATEVNVPLGTQQQLSYGARRADALGLMAESYLQHDAVHSSTADRHQVVLHVDAETLREQAPGRCHLEHGPALPVATLRRLTCDASLVRITENADGEPLDVGRKTRTIPPAIRRALNARDPGCCFPGCTSRRWLDAHHVEHWADGGATKLSNLVSLCRLHHRLVHEGGIRVEALAGGGWRFRRPDGRDFTVSSREPPSDYHWSDVPKANAARGIVVHPTAAATRWGGERIDYDHTIWILCAQARVGLPDYRRHNAERTDEAEPTDCTATATATATATTHVSAETSAGIDRTRAPDFGDDALRYWDGTAWQVIKE